MRWNDSLSLVCLYPEKQKHGYALGNKIIVTDGEFYYISGPLIPISLENFQDMSTMYGFDAEFYIRDAIKDFNFYKVSLNSLEKSKIPVNFLRDSAINEIFHESIN